MSALAPTLQAFFTDRLVRQRQASPHTVAAYRDTFRLLVRFAAMRQAVEPSHLDFAQLDATLISAFLDHREHDHRNSIRTRNAGSPPSARCFALRPFAIRSTPPRSRACWRFLRNASSGGS
jgi:site-specific recombinase XerC